MLAGYCTPPPPPPPIACKLMVDPLGVIVTLLSDEVRFSAGPVNPFRLVRPLPDPLNVQVVPVQDTPEPENVNAPALLLIDVTPPPPPDTCGFCKYHHPVDPLVPYIRIAGTVVLMSPEVSAPPVGPTMVNALNPFSAKVGVVELVLWAAARVILCPSVRLYPATEAARAFVDPVSSPTSKGSVIPKVNDVGLK